MPPQKNFDEILAEAKRLTREDRQRLVDELSRPDVPNRETPREEKAVTLYDALAARGIIGCIDGPSDLSTNPKYMEGFGQDAR